MTKLTEIQQKLKAPKNQYNDFGKYKYRSCEDILEAVKPLLNGCILTISDEVVEVGGRVYVKATATFLGEDKITVIAYAREPESRKGMDESQITGTASSYARKYALNGLFLIDDTKDADTMNNTNQTTKPNKTIDGKQLSVLIDMINARQEAKPDINVQEQFCKYYKIPAPENLLSGDYKRALETLA